MAFKPSALKSWPVSTATTPGSAAASSTLIAATRACACGDTTLLARGELEHGSGAPQRRFGPLWVLGRDVSLLCLRLYASTCLPRFYDDQRHRPALRQDRVDHRR